MNLFKLKSKEKTLSVSNYILYAKSLLIGAILTEFFFIAKLIGKIYQDVSILNKKESCLWIIGISYFLMFIFYLIRKDLWKKILIRFKSFRLDLLIFFVTGIVYVFVFEGFGANFLIHWIKSLSWMQLTILVILPVIAFISIIYRKLQVLILNIIRERHDSLFMSDNEIINKNDDKFNFLDKAEVFAERVYDCKSSVSLVFGIDAPWGMGKSSFVSLCKEYWNENYKKHMIVYTFNPLRYENRENLLEKFVDGLIKEIMKNVFAPEIKPLVSRYTNLLKDSKATFSFLGLGFGLSLGKKSLDDVFERLENALKNVDKKIVIIVDDLDRLNFSAIKEVLFVIKKAFTLPNISYVLCYDTENIAAFDQKNPDTEKITEFLEKFINIKINLFLDCKLLLEYFIENKDKSQSENIDANPKLVSKVAEGLKDIFKSRDFHYYVPLIGDARKLKRLINLIMLLEIEKTDFENCDFDKQDLIHLLLIYINYPHIFRKIYYTETQGKKGFFSVVSKLEDGYPKDPKDPPNDQNKYKNSTYYSEYFKGLSGNQKFILNKLFDVNQRKNLDTGFSTYACFNGSAWGDGGRNLEEYLNLIIKMSRPIKTRQNRFYLNCINDILTDKKKLEEVLNGEDFCFSKGEMTHWNLWKALVNTSPFHNEFKPEKSKEIICNAINSLPQYSLLKIDSIGIGLRDDLPFYIVKLIDQIGWFDGEGKQHNNTGENVAQIAKWIFGEDDHKEDGIINIIGKQDRGIIGLYDLLLFRLYCCENRGGDIYNLSRALSNHGSPEALTSGCISDIVVGEMREISQKVFNIFKSQYIDNEINIFDEINGLELKDVCGKNYDFINTKINTGEINDIKDKFARLKSTIKVFTLFQLANTKIDSGIGCGYYDASGSKDSKGIYEEMNNYLFEFCFNPKINENNYMYFLDYLLISFERTSKSYIPHINSFTKVLDKEKLTSYWKEQSDNIKSKKFEQEQKIVFTINYDASYAQDLVNTYIVLDDLLILPNSLEPTTH